MYVIIVERDNTDPEAYGPYEDRFEAVASLEVITSRNDHHVTGVTITQVRRVG